MYHVLLPPNNFTAYRDSKNLHFDNSVTFIAKHAYANHRRLKYRDYQRRVSYISLADNEKLNDEIMFEYFVRDNNIPPYL